MDQTQQTTKLEVCVDSLASAKIAASMGAQRVELNAALELGGLTPSIGLVEQTIAALQPARCQVIVMVRPRPGGFAYNADELDVMRSDIERLIDAGVDGVALGVLEIDGWVDEQANGALIQPVLNAGKQAVFHRAFDVTPDPLAALDTLISLGLTRVLTSGQAPTAIQGSAIIREAIAHANGQIEVLPGSGITPDNVSEIIQATGCDQVHASLRHEVQDNSCSANPTIQFNSPPPEHGSYHQADSNKVAAMMDALRST